MILCLTCHRLSGADAKYCGSCKRSFKGRRCKSGHLSPLASMVCVECGSKRLSNGTPALNLRWLTSGLSWLVTLIAIRLVLAHTDVVLSFLLRLMSFAFGLITGTSFACFVCRIFAFASFLAILLVVFGLFVGKPEVAISFAGRSIKYLANITVNVLSHLVRMLVRIVYGPPASKQERRRSE